LYDENISRLKVYKRRILKVHRCNWSFNLAASFSIVVIRPAASYGLMCRCYDDDDDEVIRVRNDSCSYDFLPHPIATGGI
jgi:hypothetical protein